jgi:nicotinate phosphoribosyltransferase
MIINSLLDIDFYKFTMGQVIFHRYRDVNAKFVFRNRTKKYNILKMIDIQELNRELKHAMGLRFTSSEIHYLRGTNEYGDRMFREDYLEFLKNFQLPDYWLTNRTDDIEIEISGKWSEITYWETIILSIVSELIGRAFIEKREENAYFGEFQAINEEVFKEAIHAGGMVSLINKIETLKTYPDITFCDFGTRRRFSREWQDHVVKTMALELPKQFLGTSNVHLAMKYGLLPMGTSAHEMYMGVSGVVHQAGTNDCRDEDILYSHNKTLQDWWDEYGFGLSIALTDNYGSDFFFRDFTVNQAKDWKGLRQDSGDPFVFGEKAIRFYRNCGIDPKTKLIVFSDCLDMDLIHRLHFRFHNEINVTFGWGTDLTNDVGFPTLSLIMKLLESNGHGTVKLSDNRAKALGAPEDIERFKKIFAYEGDYMKEPRS